jgi:hypothetical protein
MFQSSRVTALIISQYQVDPESLQGRVRSVSWSKTTLGSIQRFWVWEPENCLCRCELAVLLEVNWWSPNTTGFSKAVQVITVTPLKYASPVIQHVLQSPAAVCIRISTNYSTNYVQHNLRLYDTVKIIFAPRNIWKQIFLNDMTVSPYPYLCDKLRERNLLMVTPASAIGPLRLNETYLNLLYYRCN